MFVRWKRIRLVRAGMREMSVGWGVGCHHPHGPNSIRLTPIVMESFRIEGGPPKHREIWRPGINIRQCCVDDMETTGRLWFWDNIEYRFDFLEKIGHPRIKDLLSFKNKLWADFGRVVPYPSVEEWDLYRFCYSEHNTTPIRGASGLEQKRAKYRAAAATRDEWYRGRRPGEAYDEYCARRAREKAQSSETRQKSSAGGFGGVLFGVLFAADAPCWNILGLSWPATVDQVKKAYRGLAFKLHPDGGGNSIDFCKVTTARDEALDLIERYPIGG